MEGYSVTEAASVLGVPTERVWELLARGVLAGHPEGESGMRVFLQPRPAAGSSPMDLPPPTPPPAREPERELSPFRELLTEFRNLTERYGQALLALGEARGEVASLRSRVDLLEARMDLRLPMGPPVAASVGWEAPAPPSAVHHAEPELAPEPVAVEPAVLEPVDSTDMAGLADSEDAVAGVDADTVETATAADGIAIAGEVVTDDEPEFEILDAGPLDAEPGDAHAPDGGSPDLEAENAEAEADGEPHRRRRPHHATEAFAEALARAEDPTVPELPEPHREAHVEASAAEAVLPRELPAAEPIPTADEDTAPDVAPEPARVDDEPWAERAPAAAWGLPDAVAEPEREADEPEPVEAATPVADTGPDPGQPLEDEEDAARPQPASDSGPLAWDPERYTTDIGEPDWYAGEEPAPEPDGAPTDASSSPVSNEATTSETGLDDEGVDDDGAAEMEVAASGDAVEPAAPDRSDEVHDDDPLDRLDALARSTERPPAPPAAPGPSAASGPPAWVPPDPVAQYRSSLSSTSPASGAPRLARPGSPTTASRAYRRLRRIFPG